MSTQVYEGLCWSKVGEAVVVGGGGWSRFGNRQSARIAMSVITLTLCCDNLISHYTLQWSGEGDNHLVMITFNFKQIGM